MTKKHWAIFALRDIQNALDRDNYDVAAFHIEGAIEAILTSDAETQTDVLVPTQHACTCFSRRV